jgi:hypothetical protein
LAVAVLVVVTQETPVMRVVMAVTSVAVQGPAVVLERRVIAQVEAEGAALFSQVVAVAAGVLPERFQAHRATLVIQALIPRHLPSIV